jgi:thiamine kinase-like enzyme
MGTNTFQFIKIGNRHLCLQQNVLKLFIYYNLDKNLFSHSELGNSNLIKLFLYQLNILKTGKTLDLPLYGQLCIPVHGGYKIFDVFKKRVSKIFLKDLKANYIKKELEQLKLSEELNCSPKIIRIDTEQGFYQEEYLKSVISFSSLYLQKIGSENFAIYIAPLLKKIMFHHSPVEQNLNDYIEIKLAELKYERYITEHSEQVLKIKEYVSDIVKLLKRNSEYQIYTTLSHGDFNIKNMIITKSGTKLIDWEFFMDRSILHDFFNFYFSFYRKAPPKRDLINELNNSFKLIYKKLNLGFYNNNKKLDEFFEVYRLVYYLERICSLFKFRTLLRPSKKIRNIFRNIDAFKKFENGFFLKV